MLNYEPITIVSGGQTGADRAALDFAIKYGLPYTGWCPRGRRAEDDRIPERYELQETPSRSYALRTEWNIRDSDATVVFTIREDVTGGTALTLRLAAALEKPHLHLSRTALEAEPHSTKVAAATLLRFLQVHNVGVLNVAGPRASQEPEISLFVHNVLLVAIDPNNAYTRRILDAFDSDGPPRP
jgi:hypothetical protein